MTILFCIGVSALWLAVVWLMAGLGGFNERQVK